MLISKHKKDEKYKQIEIIKKQEITLQKRMVIQQYNNLTKKMQIGRERGHQKQCLTIKTTANQQIQANYSSPRSYFSIREHISNRTPMSHNNNGEGGEWRQVNYQNYLIRKVVFVVYQLIEQKQTVWNLDGLSFEQMVVILRELRYIKCQNMNQPNQQLKKCYYLWINLSHNKHMRLTNLIIVLCHIQNIQIDHVLIEDIVQQLQKGIHQFQHQSDQTLPPPFIFIVKKENWVFQDQVVRLDSQQIKCLQNQFSCFKFTRLTSSDPKVQLDQDVQDNPPFPMSKKSVQLANHKRLKIVKEIKQTRPVSTIQLYHILSYKKQLGKPAVSKLEECYVQPQPQKKKCKSKPTNIKEKKTEKGKGKGVRQRSKSNKENILSNFQSTNKNKHRKTSEEVKQITDLLTQDLGVSQITKTQILDQIDFNQPPNNHEQENKTGTFSSSQLILPQSLVLQQTQKEKKRRQYIQLPILYVDVNIDQGKKQRIVVYEGDTAEQLAQQFGAKHNLSEQTMEKLLVLLGQQIGSVLHKIDELQQQDCSYLY